MRVLLLILLLCATAWTAESPAQALFNRARAKVLANVEKVPRYTCVETITRRQYRPQYGARPNSCVALIAARTNAAQGLLTWHDRLRLDVAVADGGEMFSWAGASKFESNDIEHLAGGGSSGSGAFSSFVSSIFGRDADRFVYDGVENHLGVFDYRVPLERSHYTYRMHNGADRIIAYKGKFYLAPETADLKRLTVDATEFPSGEVCRVQDQMDYTTVKIGAGEFLLPELSTMTVLYENGEESVNETRFAGCHEYVGESIIRFDDEAETKTAAAAARAALDELPAKTRIRVRLETPLDTAKAAAGDMITAIVDRDNGPVRKGDRLHGRVLRLEQFLVPVQYWIVGIRFDTIERDGVSRPVNLKPRDDGDRSPPAPRSVRNRQVPLPTEPKGAGIFGFAAAGNLMLDQGFRTEWEVVR